MDQNILLKPLQMGDLLLKNRIGMAALTRQRCDTDDLVPSQLHVEYYAQRAEAGFILTECLPISDRSLAFPGEPGLFTDAQATGWKQVVQKVHEKGGVILAQLWHAGRVSYSTLQGGREVWGPSAKPARGLHRRANLPHEIPHEMTINEIEAVIKQFRESAKRAKEAGFDGVQLHGAHGYLVDQFLRSSVNTRADEYGGTLENRSRFCLRVIDSLIDIFGPGRVGIKLSPLGRLNDMYDEDPLALFSFLISELEKRKVSFIELKDDNDPENFLDYGYPSSKSQMADIYKTFRPLYSGILVANNQFTPEKAIQGINQGQFDSVTFGRLFISNPDLVNRIRNGQQLNFNWDVNTFYTKGPQGYTDYKPYEEWILEFKNSENNNYKQNL